jgi:hypothetical protein
MILAFCADPADDVPEDAVAWARSQRCSGSGKYWETIDVRVPHSQLLGPFGGAFKNNAGTSTSERTYSPGFFALVAVSPPSQTTPIELVLRWDVTLSCPTFNREVIEGPSEVEALVNFGMDGNNTADTPVDWNLKVFASTTRDLAAGDFLPQLQADTFYALPGGELTVLGNTGASGAPESTIVTHIGLEADKVVFYRYQISTSSFVKAAGLTAQPSDSGAPTFREGQRFRVDPDSPSRKTSPAAAFQAPSRSSRSTQRSGRNSSRR